MYLGVPLESLLPLHPDLAVAGQAICKPPKTAPMCESRDMKHLKVLPWIVMR